MIAFDFVYYKPETIEELDACVLDLLDNGKEYVYYAGGTELTTSFRQGKLKPSAVIDLKGISEMNQILVDEKSVTIGACVPLNRLIEHEELGALATCLSHIADHTVRNSLTIGGNLCGRLPYREAVMPLLGLDADVVLISGREKSQHKLVSLFDKRLHLPKDAYVYQIIVPKKTIDWQFQERINETIGIDYPIVHLLGMCVEDMVTVSVSGYSSVPVFWRIEKNIFQGWDNPKTMLFDHFKSFAKKDNRSGIAYRQHLLEHLLDKMIAEVTQ